MVHATCVYMAVVSVVDLEPEHTDWGLEFFLPVGMGGIMSP